jgi:hypothetical protein
MWWSEQEATERQSTARVPAVGPLHFETVSLEFFPVLRVPVILIVGIAGE